MKDVRQAYVEAGQDKDDGDWFCVYDYQPMLASMEYEILLQVDESDYQGDSFLLLKDGTRWGFLTYGWGSCSGCDALQSCSNWEQVAELRDSLVNDIKWYDSAAELLEYWGCKDWETQWFARNKEWEDFSKQAVEILENEVKGS